MFTAPAAITVVFARATVLIVRRQIDAGITAACARVIAALACAIAVAADGAFEAHLATGTAVVRVPVEVHAEASAKNERSIRAAVSANTGTTNLTTVTGAVTTAAKAWIRVRVNAGAGAEERSTSRALTGAGALDADLIWGAGVVACATGVRITLQVHALISACVRRIRIAVRRATPGAALLGPFASNAASAAIGAVYSRVHATRAAAEWSLTGTLVSAATIDTNLS